MVWDTDDGLHWIHNVPELHLEPRQRPFTSRARPPSRTFAYTYGVLNGVETLLGALSAHYAPEHFPLQFCRGLHSCILRMRENNLRRVELNQLIEALANYWKGQGLCKSSWREEREERQHADCR